MYYCLIPQPIHVKTRDGKPLRAQRKDAGGIKDIDEVMPALTLFDYAETWWNDTSLNEGGYRKRKQVEKIIAAFDKAKEDGAAYVALEDAEWELLKPVAERAAYFTIVWLELQAGCFPAAIIDARKDLPAVLAVAAE